MPQHFSFLEPVQGVSNLPPDAVAEPLHDVLSSAGAYLLSRAPRSRRIQALDRSLGGLASDDQSDRRIMWLAGQGMRTGWDRVKNVISRLGEASRTVLEIPDRAPLVVSGSCQAALMFGSFAPDIGEDDILPLAHTMVELSSSDGESSAMVELRRSVAAIAFNFPWYQGYDLADALHEELEMKYARGTCVDIGGMVKGLGIEVIELELSDRDIRGVSIAGQDHRPASVSTRDTIGMLIRSDYDLRSPTSSVTCCSIATKDVVSQLRVAPGHLAASKSARTPSPRCC